MFAQAEGTRNLYPICIILILLFLFEKLLCLAFPVLDLTTESHALYNISDSLESDRFGLPGSFPDNGRALFVSLCNLMQACSLIVRIKGYFLYPSVSRLKSNLAQNSTNAVALPLTIGRSHG